MKKMEFFNQMSYSKKLVIKQRIKLISIYSLSVILGLVLVLFITFSIIHFQNKNAKGGAENPSYSELAQDSILELNDLSLNENQNDLNTQNLTFDEDGNIVENQNTVSYFSYRVKKGDMISFIADEFNLTSDTIISVNSIKSSRLIQIGQYLKIPSMSGILYTVKSDQETPESIAQKYKVDATKCALANNLETSSVLKAGTTIFVPDAALDWVTRQEINGDLFKKPIHSWYYFSSWYGWRNSPFDSSKRTFHGGIDMACSSGTSVFPALEGTVIKTAYNDVYGNYIIVKHHSGYQTLYGHLSKILCQKGDFVYTNTVIGKVGSTGMSTGPHLHFTVYKNGRSVNPANLWK